MNRRLMWLGLFGAAIMVTALYFAGNVLGTPANGFTGTTLAKGRFGEISVFNHSVLPSAGGREQEEQEDQERNIWLSLQKTKGSSDLYVQTNVWQPGGSTGWHSHPGHSLIIVTAGTVTNYEGNDPSCTPHVYTEGMGFVDHGGDHAHNIRNEGTDVASTIAIQLIPADATRRIDVASPGNCPF